MSRNKAIFFVVWFLLLALGPITVFKNTPASAIGDSYILANVLQRITGLAAFTLIFFQIILGSWMSRLTEKLGGWVFKFHLTEGAFAYMLILLHPLLFVFMNFKLKGTIDPFYVFTDVCVVCRNQAEYFYTFGRVAFWLITIAVLAAKLRTQPWLQKHWRKFHILNYLAFFLIAIHSWNVGTDTHTAPFVWFYWIAVTAVIISLTYRRIYPLLKNFLPSPKPSEVKP